MRERAYPCTWFGVHNYAAGRIKEETFTGETTAYLIRSKGKKEKKQTSYSQWFPTREEAQSVVSERLKLEESRRRERTVRDAAPKLLAALKELRKWTRWMAHPEGEDTPERRGAICMSAHAVEIMVNTAIAEAEDCLADDPCAGGAR